MSICDTLELHQFVQRGGKLRQLSSKKTYCWFPPLSKILVARLLAFTAVDRFSSDYGPQTKRAKKRRCWPYFKIAHNCSVQDLKISFYMQTLVPPFLTSAPSLRLLWRRHCTHLLSKLIRRIDSVMF